MSLDHLHGTSLVLKAELELFKISMLVEETFSDAAVLEHREVLEDELDDVIDVLEAVVGQIDFDFEEAKAVGVFYVIAVEFVAPATLFKLGKYRARSFVAHKVDDVIFRLKERKKLVKAPKSSIKALNLRSSDEKQTNRESQTTASSFLHPFLAQCKFLSLSGRECTRRRSTSG
jgi:hypothetical protein